VLRQQADQVGTGFLFNAAISPTSAGNAAVLTFNTGSASQLVSMRAQSRRAGEPLGSMHSELNLGSSAAVDQDFTCPVCRWGDYAGASPDPSDGGLVWVTNMLNGPAQPGNASQWTTRIAAVSPANTPPVAGFVMTPSPATAGQPVSFSPQGSFDPDGSLGSFAWNFGDGTASAGVFPVHVFAAAGSYPISLTVTDADGTSAQSTQTLQVIPAPSPPTPIPTPLPKAPVVSSARLFPTSFVAAARGASLTRARPTGTTISYRDSQNATTTFAILRPTPGHRSGRRCLAGRPRRGQRRCTLLLTKGSFTHRDRAGAVRVHFSGRARGRKLARGSYLVTLTPRASGMTGRSVRLSFRIAG
jgi:hypothetical protein